MTGEKTARCDMRGIKEDACRRVFFFSDRILAIARRALLASIEAALPLDSLSLSRSAWVSSVGDRISV